MLLTGLLLLQAASSMVLPCTARQRVAWTFAQHFSLVLLLEASRRTEHA